MVRSMEWCKYGHPTFPIEIDGQIFCGMCGRELYYTRNEPPTIVIQQYKTNSGRVYRRIYRRPKIGKYLMKKIKIDINKSTQKEEQKWKT